MVQKLPDNLDLTPLLYDIGCEDAGIKIMSPKLKTARFLIKHISSPAANILKQEALSAGAEFAVEKDSITCKNEFVSGLLMANYSQLQQIIKKTLIQPFGLKKVALELKEHTMRSNHNIEIMGVININNDSFVKESRVDENSLIDRIEKMIEDGATIIDIGVLSSRPNSEVISEDEEFKRAQKSLDLIRQNGIYKKVKLSIDSYAPKVLKYAMDCGFSIINDITGGRDHNVLKIASAYGARLVIMHMQNDPKTMQNDPTYNDVVYEVDKFFAQQIEKAIDEGVRDIILDVGIGFGKTLEHNLKLINAQGHFLHHGYPLLIGASRKSMINAIYQSSIQERLAGSLMVHIKAIENGASIVRTHDPYEHAQALAVLNAINNQRFI